MDLASKAKLDSEELDAISSIISPVTTGHKGRVVVAAWHDIHSAKAHNRLAVQGNHQTPLGPEDQSTNYV